ncbi:CGNR zinc finger domain-containing protein [Acrocarpospora catenulata]|uniref:CGNR zinc finger domain-containing protein n=1 Tax=Acrocarpospora catenulata TaxID=2836182 RepID=UPI001BDAA359|nr:CGNR zinc finger domain-containing protein [Acrocarpospora catenulata]
MSEIVFPTGERLALDLVNTRPSIGDLLVTPDDLRAWLGRQAERFPEARELADVAFTTADLAAVHTVREHTAGAVEQARHAAPPAAADLAALNQAQRDAPAISELTWNGEVVTVTRRRTGTPGARLAAWLAEAAADLLADPAVVDIRQCEAQDCVLLFLPAHPRRRWCSAARCGNRTRVARHYQRHKPAT